jgi:hypothetical protein
MGFCKNKKLDYALKKLRIFLQKVDENTYIESRFVKSLYKNKEFTV